MAEDALDVITRITEEFKRSGEYSRLQELAREAMRDITFDDVDCFGSPRFYKIKRTNVWHRDEKGLLYSQPIEERDYLKRVYTAKVVHASSERKGQRYIKLPSKEKFVLYMVLPSVLILALMKPYGILLLIILIYGIRKTHTHLRIFSGELIWCKECETKRFKAEFDKWTSGDPEIDKFLQATQIDAPNELKYLEWIPYDKLRNIKKIKDGGFGTVYSAIWEDGPNWKPSINFEQRLVRNGPWKVALKSIKNSGKVPYEFMQELKVHYNCTSVVNHVPHCFGITKSPEEIYMIVMEYADEGDLRTYLSKFEGQPGQPSWSRRKLILQHIALGVKTVHDAGYLHHDLHPGNILVFNDSKDKLYVTIGDLGLSQKLNDPNEDFQKNGLFGIMPYIAPELLRKPTGSKARSAESKATDIYSFGMIAYEIASLMKPFTDQTHDIHLALGICNGERPPIPNNTPDDWIKLITQCWDNEPDNRPSITEIVDIIKEWHSEKVLEFSNSKNPRQPLKQSQRLTNYSNPVEDARYTSHVLPIINPSIIMEDSQSLDELLIRDTNRSSYLTF